MNIQLHKCIRTHMRKCIYKELHNRPSICNKARVRFPLVSKGISRPLSTKQPTSICLVYLLKHCQSPRTTCSPGPPIGRSDHKFIILSSAAKYKQKYTSVTKRIITENAQIGISKDLASHNWCDVTDKSDPNLKAEVFLDTVTRLEHLPANNQYQHL